MAAPVPAHPVGAAAAGGDGTAHARRPCARAAAAAGRGAAGGLPALGGGAGEWGQG